jgi:hypothetical protein
LDEKVRSKFFHHLLCLHLHAGLFLYRNHFLLGTENFSESQARALEDVAKTRHGDLASDGSVWTTGEYLTALSARVSDMGTLGKFPPNTAIRTFGNLWPGEKVPDRVEVIASRLMESGARLTEWWLSAACSGADTELKFFCSWYEGIDLNSMATLWFGAPTETNPALQAKRQQ